MAGKINRKTFIYSAGLGAASILIKPAVRNLNSDALKAIAFDAFTLFDPRPIFKTVEELLPTNGKQVVTTWRARQFSYQWLRVCGRKYKNFGDVTSDALQYALASHEPAHTNQQKDLIMAKYETMNAWPDVIASLEAFRKIGLKVCILSNMTAKMLHSNIQHSGITDHIDLVISTDEKQTYKPDVAAYQMVIDKLKFRKEEILFAPFAGWDMAGAKWFGFPTFWVNRSNDPLEKLDVEPEGTGNDLTNALEFIKRMRS